MARCASLASTSTRRRTRTSAGATMAASCPTSIDGGALMLRTSTFPRPPRLAGALILALAVVGCGGKYKPVPVSGVVSLDGAPVEGAAVYFYAVGDEREGRPAQGVTDKNGEFRLSTMGENDGALRREYKVVIAKYVPSLPKLKVPKFPDTPEGQADRQDFMYRHYESKGI